MDSNEEKNFKEPFQEVPRARPSIKRPRYNPQDENFQRRIPNIQPKPVQSNIGPKRAIPTPSKPKLESLKVKRVVVGFNKPDVCIRRRSLLTKKAKNIKEGDF